MLILFSELLLAVGEKEGSLLGDRINLLEPPGFPQIKTLFIMAKL